MPLNRGTTLGPYEIQSQLGAGGMGEVYKARDARLDRTVAIKVLLAHVADDPDLRQRFEREAKTMSSLSPSWPATRKPPALAHIHRLQKPSTVISLSRLRPRSRIHICEKTRTEAINGVVPPDATGGG